MRFLFVTIQGFETEFYGRVGVELRALGHDVEHLTASRRAAARLRARGERAQAVQEVVERLPVADDELERRRIESEYALDTIRELYRADPVCARMREVPALRRAVRIVRAVEQVLDDVRPDVLVPEVGRETLRLAAHRISVEHRIRTFFLFYTIFPRPLRLYVDTMQAPIVPAEDVRVLTVAEQNELEDFRRSFVASDEPIRAHRTFRVTWRRVRRLADFTAGRIGTDRDNEYLHPVEWVRKAAVAPFRALAARSFYRRPDPSRPFVYFPLHDTEDYKIAHLLPHLSDQAAIIDQIANALPTECDLVVKEHPQSIGQNPLALLRRVRRRPNVVLVAPRTSTHTLVRDAVGVAVISSTVGLETLLYHKPVLTIGRPFYSGYGVTIDIDSAEQIASGVQALLSFRPDAERCDALLHAAWRACFAGAPVLVDDSAKNAAELANSLDTAATSLSGLAVQ